VSVFCELWITVILELRLSRCLVFLSPRVTRYGKQRREKGHMQPKAIPGRPSKQRAQVEAGMLPQLQAHDDATLEQHGDLWEQTHGERISRWTMSRAIKRLGWTRKKKSLRATERERWKNGLLGERTRASFRANHWYVLMKAVPTWL
jgi:transposase